MAEGSVIWGQRSLQRKFYFFEQMKDIQIWETCTTPVVYVMFIQVFFLTRKKGVEEVPEQPLPNSVGICHFSEIFAGHGKVGEVLEANGAGALCQRVHIEVGDARRRRRQQPRLTPPLLTHLLLHKW